MLLIDAHTNADQWVLSGTRRGSYLGLATSGRFEVRSATFSEFDDAGLVVRDTNDVYARALLVQLGFA